MSGNTSKAMEEALAAAVSRMTQSGAAAASDSDAADAPVDPLGLLMSVIPKLLENNDEREDLVEKIDEFEKETVAPLKEQVRGLRKQVHRVFKMQEELLEELRELREQQTAVGNAVLHLAEQMARVEIVDEISDDSQDLDPEDYDDDDDEPSEEANVYKDLSSAIAAKKGRVPSTSTQRRKRPRPRRRQ